MKKCLLLLALVAGLSACTNPISPFGTVLSPDTTQVGPDDQ